MASDLADPGLAPQGRMRVEWAASRMPVLGAVRKQLSTDRPLHGLRVGACLHVTSETANLMLALADAGAEVSLCASNPLSTQDDVAAALAADGMEVMAIRGEDAERYHSHIEEVLRRRPHLLVDDGGDVISSLHRDHHGISPLGATEETTTGVNRLRAMAREGALRIPVVAVNDSATKHLFDNYYGTGQSTLDGIIRSTNLLVAGSTVVVVGYGQCGQGVAVRADGLGARVIVVEVDAVRALRALMDGHRVLTAGQAAAEGDIFITVTGNRHVLAEEHLNLMKDGAILANAGHFDVEIDVKALANLAVGRRTVRPNLEEFRMDDGRRLFLVAEGRLANLGAAEGHPADVMDLSFANQALALRWLVENHGSLTSQVYVLPTGIDQMVARLKIEALGGRLEELTGEQREYMSGWRSGT
ncbi:MAG: adenosylhomocysteinase [Actinomycetia bacterium]|nr:adenosylhomocysteinase [Actinomycetes bacterium]